MCRAIRTICLALLVGVTASAGRAQDAVPCTAYPLDAPRHGSPDTTYDVRHANLAAKIESGGSFTGRAVLEIRMTRNIDSLLLWSTAHVDSVLFDSVAIEIGTRSGGALTLALPDTVAAGTVAQLSVYYGGHFDQSADGLVAAVDPVTTWFPSSPNPHDRFTADLQLTVPAGWTVAATGIPIGQVSSSEGEMTHRYSSPHELPARRIGFAAGLVDLGTEFAELPAGRRPAVTWWMPQQRSSDRPRAPSETLPATADALAFYSEWTGYPIPFDRYTQLHVDGAPRSAAGLVRVPPRVEPAEREAAPYVPPAELITPLLQQWFGSLVSAASWHHVWLELAFPEYLNTLRRGTSSPSIDAMVDLRARYLNGPDSLKRPLVWDRWNHPADLLDEATSARGAWVLHMLRREIGADAFKDAVNLFITWNQFRSAATTDWLRAVEAVTESEMSDFADTWMYAGGHPVLEVGYASEGDVLRVRIDQVQSGGHVPGIFPIDLSLEVGALGATERFEVRVKERSEVFDLPFSRAPRYVAVDPDADWLLVSRVDQSSSAWVAQLRHATTPFARLAAAEALRHIPQEPALLLGLRAALDEEQADMVRSAIVETIGSLAPSDAAQRALGAAYDDPSPQVRLSALRALGAGSAARGASDVALRAAESDPADEVQAEAVRTLARIRAQNAVDVARAALITPSRDDVIRAAGLNALAMLHEQVPEDAFEQGLHFATAPHPQRLRVAAAHLLGRLEAHRSAAGDRLVAMLADPDPTVAAAAAAALRSSDREELLFEHVEDITAASLRSRLRSEMSCR